MISKTYKCNAVHSGRLSDGLFWQNVPVCSKRSPSALIFCVRKGSTAVLVGTSLSSIEICTRLASYFYVTRFMN